MFCLFNALTICRGLRIYGTKKTFIGEAYTCTLHLSILTNSTCLPPAFVTDVKLGIPTRLRTSASLAPPQIAERKHNEFLEVCWQLGG